MNRLILPVILTATIVVAASFAFMPVQRATTTHLPSVAAGSIADGSVTSVKIADGTIATVDIGAGAVTTAEIAADTIDDVDVVDDGLDGTSVADALTADSLTGETAAGDLTLAGNAAGGVIINDIFQLGLTGDATAGIDAMQVFTVLSNDADVEAFPLSFAAAPEIVICQGATAGSSCTVSAISTTNFTVSLFTAAGVAITVDETVMVIAIDL